MRKSAHFAAPAGRLSAARLPLCAFPLVFGLDFPPVEIVLGSLAVAALVYAAVLHRRLSRQKDVLLSERNLLKTILDHLPDCVYVTDAEGKLVMVNAAHTRLHGATAGQLLGRTFGDGQNPKEAARHSESDRKVLQDGQCVLETDEHAKDIHGRDRCFAVRKVPVKNSAGTVLGLVGISRDVTERKQAEAAFLENERMLSTLMSNLPGIAYRCCNDPDYTMQFISEGCFDLTGYRTSELYGNKRVSYANLVLAEDRARVWEEIQTAVRERRKFQVTYRIVTARGVTKWVWEQGFGVFDATDELQALEGLIIDVTERKQAEEALRSSEECFRSVWERSLDGMRLTDRDGRIVAVNAAYCRLVKLPREQLEGKEFSVTYKGHGPNDGMQVYRQRFDSGTICPRLEARAELWNSECLDLEISSSFVELGTRGKRVLSIFRDVTARRRAEQRVAAFASLGQGLSAAQTPKEAGQVICDIAGQLLGWDAYTCSLYSPGDELLTHVLSLDVIEGQVRECVPDQLVKPPPPYSRRAIKEGGFLLLPGADHASSAGHPFGDRERRSQSLLFVPIRHGVEAIGVISIQSYTPRAYDEHSLETLQALADHCGAALRRIQTNEALRLAQERRDELEGQLRQAQKMEAIGQLAGGVAHDFNNLLTVIRGNVELLLMNPTQTAGHARDFLNHVIAAADRASNLTRQLLAFSRKQVLQSKPINVNDAVENLTRMLKRIIGEDIHLECSLRPQLPPIYGDLGMIEQVVLNLVVNARDAMPEGGRLGISTRLRRLEADRPGAPPEAQSGDFIELSVSDTGLGIPPENLSRIFEPFFTTKEVGKGTGLGLATVYGIARQHRGWVEVNSKLGVGSKFRVYLPVSQSMPVTFPPAPVTAPPLPCGSETILLVEDDDAVRGLTRNVLERFGYRVHEATSGRDALDVWGRDREKIDLLLTDVIMPEGITGHQLAERLHATRPDLKIILMSGHSRTTEREHEEFMRRTNATFLQKPCPAPDLLQAIRTCLERRN